LRWERLPGKRYSDPREGARLDDLLNLPTKACKRVEPVLCVCTDKLANFGVFGNRIRTKHAANHQVAICKVA